MSDDQRLLEESAEDLYEDAPCGYISTRPDGSILKVNRTFEALIGRERADLLNGTRFQDLLAPGARIYHETHFAPLLRMQGAAREIAVDFVRGDGSRLPALMNSVVRVDAEDRPRIIRTTVFDASDRRRYERELLKARQEQSEIALQLQRGLLTKELPPLPGVEAEVVYRAARRGTEVGGDWYDAFPVGEDGIVLVVGDVVGRGIEAASQMGQLRSALRAFAASEDGPGAIVTALDDFCKRYEVGRMATVVCAHVDMASSTLRYACAGHLPPLIMRPGESPGFAWEGRSLPLATPGANRRTRGEAACDLKPGSTVALYTDGLVERRNQGFDPGMELMLQKAGEHPDASPSALAEEIVRALHDPAGDDVCLLVARVTA